MSYKLSSSHWIFFVNITHEVLSWLNVRLPVSKVSDGERGNDRKRETGRKMGRSSDSEPQYRKLGDVMHIHKTHFHLSCERKCGYVKEKKKHIQQCLLNMQAAQCQWSCEKDGCLTWLSIQSVKAGDIKEGSEWGKEKEKRISISIYWQNESLINP